MVKAPDMNPSNLSSTKVHSISRRLSLFVDVRAAFFSNCLLPAARYVDVAVFSRLRDTRRGEYVFSFSGQPPRACLPVQSAMRVLLQPAVTTAEGDELARHTSLLW